MANLNDYLKETRAEMNHVTWPTRSQAIYYTVVVVLISVAVAAYLGLLDYAFSLLVQKII